MKKMVLCILDGCGIRKNKDGNAFKNAKKPNLDSLMKKYPHSLLKASGEAVGLPKGQMGTSEVGHMNIGSGRLTYQPLEFINKSIKDKTIFKNEELLKTINRVKQNNSKLHIMGLLSDGGIHSSINHLFALIDMAKQNKIEKLYFHIFTDGRDVEPKSALKYIKQLEDKIKESGIGEIATIGGRYYGMDRDNNFDRLKKSYDTIVYGEGKIYSSVEELINSNYEKNITDEFIEPGIINKITLEDNDGLIVFNFRKDRLREMLTCITNPLEYQTATNEKGLELKKFKNLSVVTMMPVVNSVKAPYAFHDNDMKNILVDYLHNHNLSQLRIAETEKFAHVTFFFDGGKEVEYDDMKKILIPSPKVATYDLKPEMSAYEVTDKFLEEVNNYDVTIMNLANGDMVGHTGNYDAAVKAVEVLDECVGKIYKKVEEIGGTLVIIADHGNCDVMWDKDHNPVTSHTTNLVPCIVTDEKVKLNNGRLCDVVPTMLELMNLEKPKEMTGVSLIKHDKIKNIFMIISLLFLLSLVGIYTYRLVHYYKIEHPKANYTDNSLAHKVLEDNEVDEFYMKDNDYTLKGNIKNNYVSYSGYLWRIVKVNNDRTVKLVTDDVVTAINWGDDLEYNDSYIKSYLENEFYPKLTKTKKYLQKSTWCIDKIDKNSDVCKTKFESNIGLLTYDEYIKSGANNGYLNINKYWWTINKKDDKSVWYVFKEGGVNSNSIDYSLGVRPSIVLKKDVGYSGTGTKEDPYVIDSSYGVATGKYLTYSGHLWKIVDKTDEYVKVVLNECLKENDTCKKMPYSYTSSEFNVREYNSVARYLNNNFYNSLDKKYIIDGKWYVGEYDNNYEEIKQKEGAFKVGLLNVYENSFVNSYILNSKRDEQVLSLNENGMLYASEKTAKLDIYPSVYLTKDIKVLGGVGTINDPFVVE